MSKSTTSGSSALPLLHFVGLCRPEADRLEQLRQAAQTAFLHGYTRYYEMGKILLSVRRKLPHGCFLRWLAENVRISRGQASRYMRLAKCSARDTFDDPAFPVAERLKLYRETWLRIYGRGPKVERMADTSPWAEGAIEDRADPLSKGPGREEGRSARAVPCRVEKRSAALETRPEADRPLPAASGPAREDVPGEQEAVAESPARSEASSNGEDLQPREYQQACRSFERLNASNRRRFLAWIVSGLPVPPPEPG